MVRKTVLASSSPQLLPLRKIGKHEGFGVWGLGFKGHGRFGVVGFWHQDSVFHIVAHSSRGTQDTFRQWMSIKTISCHSLHNALHGVQTRKGGKERGKEGEVGRGWGGFGNVEGGWQVSTNRRNTSTSRLVPPGWASPPATPALLRPEPVSGFLLRRVLCCRIRVQVCQCMTTWGEVATKTAGPAQT